MRDEVLARFEGHFAGENLKIDAVIKSAAFAVPYRGPKRFAGAVAGAADVPAVDGLGVDADKRAKTAARHVFADAAGHFAQFFLAGGRHEADIAKGQLVVKPVG